MGHRVMHVQHVQPLLAADFRHLHGQRQRVVRVLEQAVIVDRDRMEKHPRGVCRHTERAFVTDEMHLMAAPRQFLAQRGGQNAAAANRRITGDADF